MIGLVSWLGSLWGRVVIGGALVAAIALWRASDIKAQREIGATKVASALAKDAETTRDKARKARTAARTVDDPVKRVRDAYCRDCD